MMRRSRERGFTLIEALIALAVMSVAIGVLLSVFGQGARRSGALTEMSNLQLLATSRLEFLRAEFSAAPDTFERTQIIEGKTITERIALRGAQTAYGRSAELYEIVVTVSVNQGGRRREASSTGYVITGEAQ